MFRTYHSLQMQSSSNAHLFIYKNILNVLLFQIDCSRTPNQSSSPLNLYRPDSTGTSHSESEITAGFWLFLFSILRFYEILFSKGIPTSTYIANYIANNLSSLRSTPSSSRKSPTFINQSPTPSLHRPPYPFHPGSSQVRLNTPACLADRSPEGH